MAHADMTEGVKHPFVRKHSIGQCDLVAGFGKFVGHGGSWSCWVYDERTGRCRGDGSKAQSDVLAKQVAPALRSIPGIAGFGRRAGQELTI